MRKKSIFSKAYEGTKLKESDLNVIVTEFNCVIQDEVQKEKEEFFNLKTRNVNKKTSWNTHIELTCYQASLTKVKIKIYRQKIHTETQWLYSSNI